MVKNKVIERNNTCGLEGPQGRFCLDGGESAIQQSILDHLHFTLARPVEDATNDELWTATCYAVRDRLLDRFMKTQKAHRKAVGSIFWISPFRLFCICLMSARSFSLSLRSISIMILLSILSSNILFCSGSSWNRGSSSIDKSKYLDILVKRDIIKRGN